MSLPFWAGLGGTCGARISLGEVCAEAGCPPHPPSPSSPDLKPRRLLCPRALPPLPHPPLGGKASSSFPPPSCDPTQPGGETLRGSQPSFSSGRRVRGGEPRPAGAGGWRQPHAATAGRACECGAGLGWAGPGRAGPRRRLSLRLGGWTRVPAAASGDGQLR